MTERLVDVLLWFCALGCGAIGGLYFAFSAFIMKALGSRPPAEGAAAMNAVNADILRSLFMPLFIGTTVVSGGLAVAAAVGATPAPEAVMAAGVIYVIGMFGVTMAFNVPLNNALMKAGSGDPGAVWTRYLRIWTLWNHVRTAASVLASGLYIWAI